MAAKTTRQVKFPTFRITDDASFEEFAALVGVVLKDKGALPMVAIMRAAAEQGRAFTIDGYKPSDAQISSVEYTIRFKAPKGASHEGGEGTMTLSIDDIRRLAGVTKSKGRVAVPVFELAVATKIGEDPDYVKAVSIVGDAPGAPDLCVPVKRTRKPKGDAGTDGAEGGAQDNEDAEDNEVDDLADDDNEDGDDNE